MQVQDPPQQGVVKIPNDSPQNQNIHPNSTKVPQTPQIVYIVI